MTKVIFISTGDHSGDMYASRLILELEELSPGTRFYGLGGDRMEKTGFRSLVPISEISLVGFSEVLPKLRTFQRLLGQIRRSFLEERPDLVLLIDYPGLNLRIAKIAKQLGIPVLYYIAPQLWAWHQRRIRLLRCYVDRLAVILPFEKKFFENFGVDADYVGHPILETIDLEGEKEEFCRSVGIDSSHRIVGLLPGVRHNEQKNLLPAFVRIGNELKAIQPDIQVLLSLPSGSSGKHSFGAIVPYHGDSHELIAFSDCIVTKSGTTVLEAAVLGTPMVVCYRLSRINYVLARMFIKTPYISLVNLIMDGPIVPEFVQNDVNAQNIIPILRDLFDTTNPRRLKMIEDLALVRDRLGDHRTSFEVAEIALSMFRR